MRRTRREEMKVATVPSKPMDQKDRILRAIRSSASGCWEWQKGKDRAGYGRLKVSLGSRSNFKTSSVHRYAYELWVGRIPPGMNVLHECDNPSCCNPAHLFLGSQQDNMNDMHKKGRGGRGYSRDPNVCRANALRRTVSRGDA